jgi:alkanesulfonate monooxygenase SsuD/methylene tetrahydromethanopterin reductase-like flavin-dependent oxidoreductase (luciferase family)
MTIPVGRTGLALRDPLPWPQLRQAVETAEDTGYEAVFVPEIAGREAFGTLGAFSQVTGRVLLGTGVVSIHSRTAEATAMAAATLQDLSDGRFVLGLGSGSPLSPETRGPLDLVEDYLRRVRGLLAGDDELGFHLELRSPHRVPIWVAALGDGMVRLGGRAADGVLLNWCTSGRVRAARALVREAAEAAGRDPATVTVGGVCPGVPGRGGARGDGCTEGDGRAVRGQSPLPPSVRSHGAGRGGRIGSEGVPGRPA